MNDLVSRRAYAIIYADRQSGQSLTEQAEVAGMVMGLRPDDCLAYAHERRAEIVFTGRSEQLEWDVWNEILRMASMDFHLPMTARHAVDPVGAVRLWNERNRTTVGPWTVTK